MYTKITVRTVNLTVSEITENQVIFNKGNVVNDDLGNLISSVREREVSTSRQFFVAEYSLGKRWQTRFVGTGFNGERMSYEYNCKVVKREQKTVPAGTFDAFKVEAFGYSSSGSQLWFTYWVAPEKLRKPIATERENRSRTGRIFLTDGEELTSYRQQG